MHIIPITSNSPDFEQILNRVFFYKILNEKSKKIIQKHAAFIELEPHELLMRQGEAAEDFYFVYSGKLGAYNEGGDWQDNLVGIIKHDEIIGEMAIFTKLPRAASVRALRQSFLIKIPNTIIYDLIIKVPEFMFEMSRIISERMKRLISHVSNSKLLAKKVSVITVIPAGNCKSIEKFMSAFLPVLSQYQPCCDLNSTSFKILINKTKDSFFNAHLDKSWTLAKLENEHPLIILHCDNELTEWSHFCIKNSDCFLFVTEVNASRELNKVESYIYQNNSFFKTIDKKLILLHSTLSSLPTTTSSWLESRNISFIQHICLNDQETLNQLARFLSNRCIGLVLSGGGVLGLAHLGVIKALQEAGITIDVIGGVSSGAIMGGLFATGLNIDTIILKLKKWIKKLKRRRLFAWQIPLASLIKPNFFQKIFDEFPDIKIEDLCMHFFSLACNLNTTKDEVFDRGSLANAVLASNAVPGVFSPFLTHGELYVDGGVSNTMPGDVMKERFGGITIAVNVSQKRDIEVNNISEYFPSTTAILLNKLNPFKKNFQVPSLPKIITRTIVIANKRKLSEVKEIVDYVIEPDFSNIKTNYNNIDELIEIGYKKTKEELAKWNFKDGVLISKEEQSNP